MSNIKIAFLLLLMMGCTPRRPAPERAFYHWKSHLALSQEEIAYLRQLRVTTLYARFFDVDWDEEAQDAVPLAEVRIDTAGLGRLRVIPAVFITNKTMQQLPRGQIPLLAKRIWEKLEYLGQQLPNGDFEEIHLDCDWTSRTREPYFTLLEELRSRCREKNRRLSVTIRLHQWTFMERTGVPPADAGMLMYYNTGKLENWEETNSILSREAIRPYLRKLKPYPLPLGVAAPVFQWGVVFRNETLFRLIHGLNAEMLQDTGRFRQIASDRFQVEKSTYLDGYYLYKGDRIRLERVTPGLLQGLAAELQSVRRKAPPFAVAMYHLEPALIQRMPYETMDEIFRKLEK